MQGHPRHPSSRYVEVAFARLVNAVKGESFTVHRFDGEGDHERPWFVGINGNRVHSGRTLTEAVESALDGYAHHPDESWTTIHPEPLERAP